MKKLLASFLATIIGTFGIACIDQEARDMIVANSQKIDGYYSEYKEDISQIEESITQCNHICKDYDEDISNLNSKIDNIEFPECSCKDYSHLEEQYNELSVKYEELSLICEENKPKEYRVGDRVEIPVYCYNELIDTVKCFIIIKNIDQTSVKRKYLVETEITGYFYTKNLGSNTYTSYQIIVADDFVSNRSDGNAVVKNTGTILSNGSAYCIDNFSLSEFYLSGIALEHNATALIIHR